MKNYLIVGASSGIGKALTEVLKSKGHVVITASRHDADIIFDATKDTLDINQIPSQLDGLVYCPGSINLKPFARLTDQEFKDDFELNVLGAIKVIRTVLPQLKSAEQSSIVLFSTVAVNQGMPFHASVSASKGALEGLTKSMAAEFSPKIRVNCIAPSLTDTPLASKLLSSEEKKKASGDRHPLKRVGEPIDIARMADFLLSDDASWTTGQILRVDGGMSTLRIV